MLALSALLAVSPSPSPSASPRTGPDRLRTDWAYLARYRDADAALGPPKAGEKRVVFLGDSITEQWGILVPSFFNGSYVNRGIDGQTTPQMLVRFRQDVIDLKPAVVMILGGTNDIAGNTGPSTLKMIEDNLTSMSELAHAHGIRVVLSSVLPVYRYPWRRALHPTAEIVELDRWIRDYASAHGDVYCDYYSAMVDRRGGIRAELTRDGVHPNVAGYAVMAPIVQRSIASALSLSLR